MSISVVSFVPDIETVLVKALRDNLNAVIGYGELRPKYGNVRVSLTHPFVELMDQKVQGAQTTMDMFPAITLASVSDSRLPGYAVVYDENPIAQTDLVEIVASKGYMIAPSQLTALQSYLAVAPVGAISKGTSVTRTHSMALEIWADNLIVKNELYDLCVMALSGMVRMDLKAQGITVKEEELKGQRSGNYNMDFGKMLYGANLNFSVDVAYWQIAVDTTQAFVSQVLITLNDSSLAIQAGAGDSGSWSAPGGDMTTYNATQRQGDTYNGAQFTIVVNGSPMNLTGASIKMDMRKSRGTPPAITLSVGSGLSITNAGGGQFQIDPQIFPLTMVGVYLYDIEITVGAVVKTYVSGTFTFIEDITHV